MEKDALKAPPKKGAKAIKDIELLLRNDKIQAERESITKKAIDLSFVTRLHQERKEAETEAACANAKVSQGWRAQEVKQEDKLGREIAKDKYKLSKDLKLRELLKDSEEIRELERKIKHAYLHKDLEKQLAEKEAFNLSKKLNKREELKRLIELEKKLQEIDLEMSLNEKQKKFQYKEELQDQIIDRQKMKEEIYRNLLDEKAFIDEAVKTVWEEDKRDEELKIIRKQNAKEEAEAMLKAKKLWIEKETKYQEEEDRKIRQYLEDKNNQEKELQKANKQKEEMRLLNRVACVQMINSSEEERLERQRIAQILLDEDTRQKEEEKLRQDFERKRRNAYECKEITTKQIENRLQRIEEEKLEDLKFCQQLLEENNRSIMREQEEQARRRQENVAYGRSLKYLMDQQRINKLNEMEEQYQQHCVEIEEIKKRRAIIDEERLNILKKHVGNLVGHLPKGVIRKDELPYLDPEVRKYYETQTNLAKE